MKYRRVYSHHFHNTVAESIHTTPNSIQCPFKGALYRIWPICPDMLPTSAWCRPYRQIWPICPDMLPTSAWCRPYQQMWPICPDMQPTSALYRPYICRYGRSSGRLVPRFCRRRPYRQIWPICPDNAADVGLMSAISANMADLSRYAADVGLMSDMVDQCRSSADVGPTCEAIWASSIR